MHVQDMITYLYRRPCPARVCSQLLYPDHPTTRPPAGRRPRLPIGAALLVTMYHDYRGHRLANNTAGGTVPALLHAGTLV
jgi:hypothetical protein